MTALTVIILTQDEERHIGRAIASVRDIATRILVVDSGSSDATVAIACKAGAEVMHHAWVNHAVQFNWALDQLKDQAGWILRLDADEVVTPKLSQEIKAGLPDVDGMFIGRRIRFMGQTIRYGGLFPVQNMRLFRNGAGRCEARWMDEHIVVDGATRSLRGEIIDDNCNSLDWWIAKHNAYASREVIDVLNREYGLETGLIEMPVGSQTGFKRWLKVHLYGRLPAGLRAGAYFFYRYVIRFGFLDGAQARSFHVLQGFWYRYLVDAKLAEVRREMQANGDDPVAAIRSILGIDVTVTSQAFAKQAA